MDAAGNESARSEATTFTTLESEKPAPEKPAAPINVKISEIKHTKALVTWDSVLARAAVEGYNVYLDGEKVNATPVKETRYELTGLKVGTKYNVAVTAVNEEGTESEITEEVEETFITLADMEKLNNTAEDAKKALEEKEKNTVLWVLAIIGAVAAVAGIAFAVYHFFAPDYLVDFEEDFDDDFDDYFEDEEE